MLTVYILQLKMRGQRVRYNENGDGEVDENFWAQAAASQAAGRGTEEEGDDSKRASLHLNPPKKMTSCVC